MGNMTSKVDDISLVQEMLTQILIEDCGVKVIYDWFQIRNKTELCFTIYNRNCFYWVTIDLDNPASIKLYSNETLPGPLVNQTYQGEYLDASNPNLAEKLKKLIGFSR